MDQTDDLDRIAEMLDRGTADEFDGSPDPGSARERYELLATMKMNAAGLVRYWQKRAEREAAERDPE